MFARARAASSAPRRACGTPAGCLWRNPCAAAAAAWSSSVASRFTSETANWLPASALSERERDERRVSDVAAIRSSVNSAANAAVSSADRAQVQRRAAPCRPTCACARRAPSCARRPPARARAARNRRCRTRRGCARGSPASARTPACASSTALRAISCSDALVRLRERFDDVPVAVARGEVLLRRKRRPGLRAASARRRSCSPRTARQSSALRKRRLPMLLLTETWSAACCWFSDCTSCSIVEPDSDSRCSIHVSGSASAEVRPCRRRTSSATKGPAIGGSDRAMSAMIEDEAVRIALGGRDHAVRPRLARDRARARPAAIRIADAPQVLDQREPQHDRYRPQLAELERRDASGRPR